jgi:hypothetical protein
MTTRERIELLAERTENWWRPLYYHVVPKIINDNGYKTGIEIGVAFGGHAEAIFQNTSIEILVCVDPWEFTGAEFEGLKNKYDYDEWAFYVRQRLLDLSINCLVERTTSDEFAKYAHNNFFDFVFIDGDHSYEQVKKDIQNYLPKIKSGGMLIGHDYGHADYMGVKQAVDEFIQGSGKELVLHDGYVWSVRV